MDRRRSAVIVPEIYKATVDSSHWDYVLETIAKQAASSQLQVVVELHERAVTDVNLLQMLSRCCRNSGLKLAYDDFGAGEARLLELADVPPDFIKLDRGLIAGIDQSPARQSLPSRS